MICEVFILFCSLNALVASADLIRQTDLGLVHGILEQWDNRSVECYHGIPYAAPPVNSLRFQPPTLHPGWNDTLNATAFGPMCPQELLDSDRIYGDEDCLRLNIFVPHDGVASSKLLPVMIWLHGGAFVLGSGNYNAHVLADFGQVIVVTINYRLGVFGFLSTGDNATTGNNGLLDQRFAILWVKTNIKNFGGNPEAIVLFGQSAGGVSVALQCLSPLNTGLFSKAILQSGVALAPRAVRLDDPSIWAKKLASILSCPVNDSYSLISCLQAKTSAELIKGAIELHSFNFEFVPTVDGLFLPKPPQELYRDTSLVNRYSYLAGVNSQEGSLAWPQIKKITSQADFFNFTSLFLQLPPDKVMMVTEAILWEYRDWTDLHHSSSHLQRQALDMVGDVSFIAPLMMTSDFLANTKKGVYIYYFTRHPNASLSPNWMGAGHGDELPFVFGVPIMGGSLVGEQELALSEQIMTYWTNFAKTSNPNSPRKSPVIWPKYNKRTARYLQLDINLSKLNIKKDLKPRRVAFWNKLFPSLLKVKECPVTKPRNDPLIKTQHGLLRGIRLQQNGKLTDIFKGIPYAQPPTGEFRFQKPRPLNSWKGIRDAKTYGNICTQDRVLTKDVHGDEDCLTLNIWIPHGIQGGHVAHQIQAFVEQSSQPQENGISNNGLLNGPFYREALQKRLAVMIWIHGGAFAIGSSLGIGVINTTIYDGRELAHQGQVIVVSVNYRLGALGFLSTGDGNARGNYGLWDQHAAMAWVKSNIANFGGNPELITIFGESAGGTCTSIHILSPVSKGLFRRAVSQSGDARAIWGVNRNPLRAARRLAQSVGCPWEDNAAMMFCLRQVPAKDIVLAIRVTELLNKEKLIFFLPFVPTIDGEFLPAEPEMLFENSKDIDYLLGCNSGDAHMFVSTWFPGVNMPFGISQAKFRTAVEKGVGSLGEDAMESVIFEYTDWENPSEFSRRQGLSQLYTDMEFCAPAFGSAQRHKMMARNASRTYVYQFSYPSRMPNLIWPEWIGALHTEELPFLFGRPFSTLQSYNQQEKQLSQAMMKYWSNFAKTGNPNYPESVPIIWPEHSTEKYYMDLNVNLVQESVGKNLRAKQFAMWNELISKMVSRNINCLEDKIPPQNGTVPEITAPTVTVQQGQMKGFISEDFLGGFLQIFLGIPYASPPVGELRFKPPKEASSWSGTLDATHLRAACPQSLNDLPRGINHTSEDCLYLNVYAPIRTSNSSLSLPVMVHIHHGSLQCGAAGAYDMKNLAAYGQVVVVEFNYRLGPLGFLTTLDVNAPGNLGFLDMSKGLQWIRGNIQSFGGDPTRVTLFGHGAGGLAVNYLLLSPLTRGLFHRAISSSGNALVTGSLAKRNDNYSDPLVATQELAKALGCPTDNNAKMVDCLRTKPVESLLDAPVPMSKYGIKFAPIIDGVFLQESPWDSLLKGNYMKIPYIIGLTNDEEGAELANLLGNDNGISTETYHKMMLGYSSAHFRYNPAQMADVIDYSYRDFNRPNDPKALRDGFRDLVQDHKWLAPSYQLTDQHSTRADTFLYIYSHPASSSRISPWIGASHLDDLLYLFGDPVAKNPTQEYNEAEKQISFGIMAYWTNFAHNGNPNEGPHRIAKWPKYTPTNREFVNFTADRSDWTGNSYRSQQTAFWNRIALKMQSKDWCNKNGEKPLPVNTTTTARPTTTRSPELCNVTQDITQDILSMNLTAEEIITAFYVSFALLFIEAFLSLGLLYKLYMQWRKLRKLQCLITPPEVFLKGITDENTPHAKF